MLQISCSDGGIASVDLYLRQVLDSLPEAQSTWSYDSLPDKEKVLENGKLIHPFIVATQGIEAPEVKSLGMGTRRANGFYINSKGGGVPHRMKMVLPS